ncbi:MAG: hypothetical protein B2I17_01950 [Thermoplasmatales archaeon B_DKE]|nr:MAG: hypothetical protein B2I17_01950 [Thermoplasmatales archaeon B_DKE]
MRIFSRPTPPTTNKHESHKLSSAILDVRDDVSNIDRLHNAIQSFSPELVFHLAALLIVVESYDNHADTFDTNMTGIVSILNEFRRSDSVESIIVVTSDKSYLNKE